MEPLLVLNTSMSDAHHDLSRQVTQLNHLTNQLKDQAIPPPDDAPGSTFAEVVLWLFVVNLGIAFGGALYEHRIVLPQWFPTWIDGDRPVDADAMRRLDSGRSFWAFVTTIPLTLLTVASLVLVFQVHSPVQLLWGIAAGWVLLERLATFAYFIPFAIAILRCAVSDPSRAARLAMTWQMLNGLRLAVVLGAWLTALKALTLWSAPAT